MVLGARNRLLWLLVAAFLMVLSTFYLTTNYSPESVGYSHYESGINPRGTRKFRNLIVHIDLKGAPPRVEYLEKIFELLAEHHVDGVLMEYEDMFPYSGKIQKIARASHYTEEDIRRILKSADKHNLEVIPLIQSFGHLEFVLKLPEFMRLSEDVVDLNTICISDEQSIEIVEQMITQIRRLHPNSTRIHIGADEAYHVAEDKRCEKRMEKEHTTKSQLKMEHIARIGKFAKKTGFSTVFAWNDMFDKEPEHAIREAGLNEHIVPVVWGYREDVTEPGYFPEGLFERMENVFEGFYVASAFKGANGQRQQFSNVTRYLEVQKSYIKLMDQHPSASKKVQGIFVTGWSRYNHFNVLCELLPVAIPSLVVDLLFLNYQLSAGRSWKEMKQGLGCENSAHLRGMRVESALHGCTFPGSRVFEIIMHDWKRLVDRRLFSGKSPSQKEVLNVLETLKSELAPILYKTDIDEVYNQYLQDYHAIQTVTPRS